MQQRPGALLVGPDGESAQWVAQAAARHGLDHAVCTKERHGDRSVSIQLPPVNVQGRAVVLLDDMASTGHTLAQATRLLLQAGAASVDVAVTHALIDAEALAALHAAGAGEFWSTDCVAHPTNTVAMAMAAALGGGLPGLGRGGGFCAFYSGCAACQRACHAFPETLPRQRRHRSAVHRGRRHAVGVAHFAHGAARSGGVRVKAAGSCVGVMHRRLLCLQTGCTRAYSGRMTWVHVSLTACWRC